MAHTALLQAAQSACKQCHFLFHFCSKYLREERRIKLKGGSEENHQIVRLGSFSTKLPSWGDLAGFLPVFLQFLTFVVAAFCRARPSVLPRSGWFKEHLLSSAHQFCTYQPSSTNNHHWGICVSYTGGIGYTYIFQSTVFKALTESYNWNENHLEMDTGGSREHCSSSSQEFYRFCVPPCAHQSTFVEEYSR